MDEEENDGRLEEVEVSRGQGFKGDSKSTSKLEQLTSSISNKMEKMQNEFKKVDFNQNAEWNQFKSINYRKKLPKNKCLLGFVMTWFIKVIICNIIGYILLPCTCNLIDVYRIFNRKEIQLLQKYFKQGHKIFFSFQSNAIGRKQDGEGQTDICPWCPKIEHAPGRTSL